MKNFFILLIQQFQQFSEGLNLVIGIKMYLKNWLKADGDALSYKEIISPVLTLWKNFLSCYHPFVELAVAL